MSGVPELTQKMRGDLPMSSPASIAERKAARAVKGWHSRMIRRTIPLYAKQVEKELGGDGKAGVCALCERPFITDRAFRAVERALDRVMGTPQLNVLIANMIGATPEQAKEALTAMSEVEHLDEAQQAAMCLEAAQKFYSAQGKRVVVLDDATNGGSHAEQATENGAAG